MPKLLAALLTATLLVASSGATARGAAENWESVDKQVQPAVYRVNVAIKVQLKGNMFAQLADLSPRHHYPVFVTMPQDQGFRVVGSGTCFAIRSKRTDGTYFLTNRHVVDFADGMLQECSRFYAAMHLHAERTAGFSSPDKRFEELMRVVNLAMKKDLSGAEKTMYQATVDSIWETYDGHLTVKADPKRTEFRKHVASLKIKGESGFFLHPAGPSSQASLQAQICRSADHPGDPDLTVLFSKEKTQHFLEFDHQLPAPGEVVQAVGYPVIKQSGVSVPAEYQPAFTTGRVKRSKAGVIEFEAPVSKGDSGGPLINRFGRVVGVVARRGMSGGNQQQQQTQSASQETPDNKALPSKYASAIGVAAISVFAPELFGH